MKKLSKIFPTVIGGFTVKSRINHTQKQDETMNCKYPNEPFIQEKIKKVLWIRFRKT